MSEKIKVTVVAYDEKPNDKNDESSFGKVELTQESGLTLMSALLKNGLIDGSFCGGRGDCGRCIVQFFKGTPLPTGLERSRLEPEELRRGYRLACMAKPKTDCTIRIMGTEKAETPIVTEMNLLSGNIDLNSQENNLSEKRKALAIEFDEKRDSSAGSGLKNSSVISENRADVIKVVETVKEVGSKKSGRYIIAVDLGTTTIAMQLRDAETGEVVDTYCAMNPQRRYGTDVLARIQAAADGQGEELRRLVCGVVLAGLGRFAVDLRGKAVEKTWPDEPVKGDENGQAADPAAECADRKGCLKRTDQEMDAEKILCMCIAGNTVMEHLLLGMDVSSLGRAPFVPVEKGLQHITAARLFAGMETPEELRTVCEVFSDMPVYIAPCISAFVGGDIVAGLYALGLFGQAWLSDGRVVGKDCGAAEKEWQEGASAGLSDGSMTERGKKAALMIDLGTNGEMVLTDGQRMIVTATAAGPAFEGDGTMTGTDRIALTAQLLRKGILDATGLLEEPYFTQGVRMEDLKPRSETGNGKENNCYFKQKDIRSLQMAKAAVRAGVEILWEEMGRPEIVKVFLAGGFGYYLDVEAAAAVGLLPSHMRGRVQAAGNTSLAGAYELGRGLCGNWLSADRLEERIGLAESINLAESERFEGLYMKYMNLGEN